MGKCTGCDWATKGYEVRPMIPQLRANKTKIVCTLGPSSEEQSTMEKMIIAGMDVARLNFSHGDALWHEEMVSRTRRAAQAVGRPVTIMADLPGPKIRIGKLEKEPVELKRGQLFTLTEREVLGDERRCTLGLEGLSKKVKKGDSIFLNDGIIRLEVLSIRGEEIECLVVAGGELRSHKGVNIPGVSLGSSAFTESDKRWLELALSWGIDVVCQSFVETPRDLKDLRDFATDRGRDIFLVAKLERSKALENLDGIMREADGIMIARGDLGVEVEVERVPMIQKMLIRMANGLGKPVITATQMLESMVEHPRPTRAEATDVANAVLDGTDCVMLSGESAAGKYPVEAVETMARIACLAEGQRSATPPKDHIPTVPQEEVLPRELLASAIGAILEKVTPLAIFVPTKSGATARSIAKLRPSPWIVAVTSSLETFHALGLTRGVMPVLETRPIEDWNAYIGEWLEKRGMTHGLVLLTEGPSQLHPEANHRVEILELRGHKT